MRVSELLLARKARDYAKERKSAMDSSVDRVVALRDDRDTGALGDEVIKMAQALILCTLPYRPTEERQVVRSARLSDGSTLRVTFTAGITGIGMAYGNDHHPLPHHTPRLRGTIPIRRQCHSSREISQTLHPRRKSDPYRPVQPNLERPRRTPHHRVTHPRNLASNGTPPLSQTSAPKTLPLVA